MLSLRKRATRIIRNLKNSHRFVYFIDGKIRTVSTHIDDINSQIAALFGALNTLSVTRALPEKALLAVALAVMPLSAFALDPLALPTGYESVSGNHQFSQTPGILNVTTSANRSIVNYQTFNIGKDAQVNFNLPSSSASILNRVVGGNMSEIYGTMTSNGKVFLVNPAGIFFGNGANVTTNGLVASTLNISDQKFLAGLYEFSRVAGSTPGQIRIEQGAQINVLNGGSASFIGASIVNAGNINASGGVIQFGVGDRITLGDDLIGITVNEPLQDTLNRVAILNTGNLTAAQIKLVAATLKQDVLNVIVNNSGRISANKVIDGAGGSVELIAENGIVNNSGTVDANGSQGGLITLNGQAAQNSGQLLATGSQGQGGQIHVLGSEFVALSDQALVNASGQIGGGSVLVGGDYLGGNPLILNTLYTYVGQHVLIKADALNSGNGGKVIVWANEATGFYGNISAQGGLSGGNGGFVETSGKNYLDMQGNVNAIAHNGNAGTWLLDPRDVKITDNNNDIAFLYDPLTNTWTGSPTSLQSSVSEIKASSINTALNAGTNVTIHTNNSSNNNGNNGGTNNGGTNNGNGNNNGNNGGTNNGGTNNGNGNNNGNNGGTNNGGTNNGNGNQGQPQNGDILINSLINKTSGTNSTLTLLAANNIVLNSSGGITASGAAPLHLVLKADHDIGAAVPANGEGAVRLNGTILTNNGNVTITGASIDINNHLNAGTGNITITAAENNITQTAGTLTGNTVSMTTDNGNINQTGGSIKANSLILNATNGNILQSGGTMSGTSLSANTLTTGKTIIIADADFNSANLKSKNGAITYNDRDGITVTVDAGNTSATITAGTGADLNLGPETSGISLSGTNKASSLALTANKGNISQLGGTVSGTTLNAETKEAGKTLSLTDTDFASATLKSNNGGITYNDTDGATLNLNAGSANADITIGTAGAASNNGALEADLLLTGNNKAKTMNLTANGGNISQTVGSIVSGDTLNAKTTASSKTITLANADFSNADLKSNFGDINYTDNDGISIHVDVGGSAANTANITSGTDPDLNTGGEANGIRLTGGNQAGVMNIKAKLGDITQSSGALNAHTANLTAENGGIIQNNGLLSAVNLTLNSTNGNIVQNNGTMQADLLSLVTSNGSVQKTGGIITAQTLNIQSTNGFFSHSGGSTNTNSMVMNVNGGNIVQTGGAITGNTLSAETSSNGQSITLNNTDFSTATLKSQNGSINYSDSDGVTITTDSGTASSNITVGTGASSANANALETGLQLTGTNNASTINLTAQHGAIAQTSGTVTGSTLNAETKETNQSISLTNADFNNANLKTQNGNITYNDADAIIVNIQAGTGIASIGTKVPGGTANNASDTGASLTLTGGNNAAILNVTAHEGAIGQAAKSTVTGITLNAETKQYGKTINLTDTDFTNANLKTNNGNITLNDRDGIMTNVQVGSGTANLIASASGLNSNNGIVESGLILVGDNNASTMNLTANNGDITQTLGSALSGNSLVVKTANGQVALNNNNANDFRYLTASSRQGDVSYRDTNDINLTSVNLNTDGNNSKGNLTIQTNNAGNITQTGNIDEVNTLSIITDQGNTILTNIFNNANHLNVESNQGNVSYRNIDTINVDSANLDKDANDVRGSLFIQTSLGGNINQTGNIVGVDTLKLRTDSGNTNLTGDNNVNKLDAGSNVGSVFFSNTKSFVLTGANMNLNNLLWKGDLSLTAKSGIITQLTSINASELKITGNADLTNSNNRVDVFSAFGSGATVSYTDLNGFNLGRSDVGNGTLSLGTGSGEINQTYYFPLLSILLQNRNITDNGGITAGTVNLTLGAGANANLTDINNAIGNFSLNGNSSCTNLVNSTTLNLADITDTTGVLDVSIQNAQNLTQSGAINLRGLKVTMQDGGDFMLENTGNNVQFLSANAAGLNTANSQGSFVDGNGGFALSSSNMHDGDLSLTARSGGNISQAGVICPTGNCSMPVGGINADELKVTIIDGGDADLTTQLNHVRSFSANANADNIPNSTFNSQILFANNQDLNIADSNLKQGDLGLFVNGNIRQTDSTGQINHWGIIRSDELKITLLNGGQAILLNPNKVNSLAANATGNTNTARVLFFNDKGLNLADSQLGSGDLGLIVNGDLRQDALDGHINQWGHLTADELALIMLGNKDATLDNNNRINALSVNALGLFGPSTSQIRFTNSQNLNVGFSILARGDLALTLRNGANLDQNHLSSSRDLIVTGGIFGNELSINMLDGGSADLTTQLNKVDVFSAHASNTFNPQFPLLQLNEGLVNLINKDAFNFNNEGNNTANSVIRFHNIGNLNIAASDVGQGKLYVSTLGSINNNDLSGNNRNITFNTSSIQGGVVQLTTFGNGSINLFNNVTANQEVRLTTANSLGGINILPNANIESKTGSVYINTDHLAVDGYVQGRLVQLWPWNLSLSMGIAGGSGVLQLNQGLINHINTDQMLGLNTLMFGHRDYTGTITLGTLNMSGHSLTDVAFNAPRVFDGTPTNDSTANLIMAANRNVYLTSGADTISDWATALGGTDYGSNSSRFADLDIQVRGNGLIHVKLKDYIGIGNAFSIRTSGGNSAFINTQDNDNSGTLRNLGSALSGRTSTLILNQIKGTTITLPGNPIEHLPTSFGNVKPVQFIPNQSL